MLQNAIFNQSILFATSNKFLDTSAVRQLDLFEILDKCGKKSLS